MNGLKFTLCPSDFSNTVSQYLMYAEMQIISDAECQTYYSPKIFESMICATGYCEGGINPKCSKPWFKFVDYYFGNKECLCEDQNTCNGDSGVSSLNLKFIREITI